MTDQHRATRRRSGEDKAAWELVNALGNIASAPPAPGSVTAAVDTLGVSAAFDTLVAHRVYSLALERLQGLDASPAVAELTERLVRLQAAETQRRDRVREVTRRTLRASAEQGVRVMKGLALRTYYRHPEWRHEGDIDLHVSTWPAAREVAARLRTTGWDWDTAELPWLKWTDDGHLYGQLSLVLDGPEEADTRVDLHIGPYSVGHGGLMPLVGWHEREVLGVAVRVPSTESALALIGAHAMNDCLLSQKDVNDVAEIIAAEQDIDWGSVEELAHCAQAAAAIRQIRRQVELGRRASADGRDVPEIATGPLTVRGFTGLRRALRFGRLALSDERRRGGVLGAAPVAIDAIRYYNADLAPRLVPTGGEDMSTASRGRTSCWRLVPAPVWSEWNGAGDAAQNGARTRATTLGEDLTMISGESGSALVTMGEVFVPTITGRVSAASVALARTLARR